MKKKDKDKKDKANVILERGDMRSVAGACTPVTRTAHVLTQPLTINDIVGLVENGGFSLDEEYNLTLILMRNRNRKVDEYNIKHGFTKIKTSQSEEEKQEENPKTLIDKIKAFFYS